MYKECESSFLFIFLFFALMVGETRANCIISNCTNPKQDRTMKPFMHMVSNDTSPLAKGQTRVSDCFGGLKVLVLGFCLQYCPHPVLTFNVHEFKSILAHRLIW